MNNLSNQSGNTIPFETQEYWNDTRFITVLNVLSALAVVYLHTNSCFWSFEKSTKWIEANIIECLFYFAVPIFFMISGATLLDYRTRYSSKTFMKKRLSKTLFPFIIWSTVWFLARLLDGQYANIALTPQFIIEGFLLTRFQPNYWFFIPLFTCYAAYIIISLVPYERRKKIFGFMIICGFTTISFLPFVCSLLNIGFNDALKFPISSGGYLLFALLGYYLTHYRINFKLRLIIYFGGIAGLLSHILCTYYASFDAGYIVSTYKGYMNVPSVLYSTAIFTFFRYVKKGNFFNIIHKFCKFGSSLTFGIYLIHNLFLEFLIYKLPFDHFNIYFRIFGSIGVFLACGAIVFFIKKIPFVKKILP